MLGITRILPHSIEAEAALLGVGMLDPQTVMADAVAWLGSDGEAFYDHRHKVIYRAMATLYANGQKFDPVTLGMEMKKAGTLDESGGMIYLTDLFTGAGSSSGYRYWLSAVKEKAALRRAIEWATELVSKCYDPDASAETLLSEYSERILGGMDGGQEFVTHGQALTSGMELLEKLYSAPDGILGVPTGFKRLDRYTRGMKEGEFWILGGPPSLGKTALSLNMILQIAVAGVPVGMISMEQSATAVALRSLASGSSESIYAFPYSADTFRKLTSEHARQAKLPIVYDDRSGLNISRARASIRRMVHRHKARVVVVDYLQLMEAEQNNQGATEAMTAISKGLKNVAKELKITVLALSQLNRESRKAGRVAALHDLRGSGQLEQDADIALLLHGEATEKNFEGWSQKPVPDEMPDLHIVNISKNREGMRGDLPFRWIKEHFKFEEWWPRQVAAPRYNGEIREREYENA